MGDLVLIADGNSERGKRVAEACSERGIRCHVVTHGAAALEVALAELPSVLVVQLDLPLIDGVKLGEILHTNPRTQSLSLVFLADRGGVAERPRLGAEVIPPTASIDDVAKSVHALLDERRSTREGGAEVGEDAGVEGELAQLPLADLLQLFQVSRKTGVVELERQERNGRRESGRVLVSGGDVVHAVVGTVEGEKALYRLIAWERGSFAFRPGPVAASPTITKPTRLLLREGQRQLKEWERLAASLPPMDAYVTLKIQRASLPNVIHPLTQEVLMVLELHSRVGDVVDHCSYPDYQVLRMLDTLIGRGMLELRQELPEPPGDGVRPGLFSPHQASRLREWLKFDGLDDAKPMDAKLVVVSSNPDASREFVRLVRHLSGVELSECGASGALPADEIVSLGRIAVDNEVGIEFIQIPSAERFAPLWGVAAHGALGILVVLAGPVTAAVQAIRRAAGALGKQPRSRLFHLLLLEKGQGVAPEALRENISLLDETSLFLVPQENDEKARILLREMFGHILP